MKEPFIIDTYKNILIIAPDTRVVKIVMEALALIERSDDRDWAAVGRCLKAIFIPTLNGYKNGVYEQDRVWIAQGSLILNNPVTYTASLIIHESYHIAQYLSGHKYELPKSELSALKRQKAFLEKIKDSHSLKWINENLPEKWWEGTINNEKTVNTLDKWLEVYRSIKSKNG